MKNLFLLINCLYISQSCVQSWAMSTNEAWLSNLRQKGLILKEDILDQLKSDPTGNIELRSEIAKKYHLLLKAISARKQEFKIHYQQASDKEKHQIINNVQALLSLIITKVLTPLWMGGPWDFNGVPGKKPDINKPVACGHFVQKILENAGFNIVKNQGTWLAYLSQSDVIRTLVDSEPKQYTTWDSVEAELKKQGLGVYVFGLECGWGHVLFGSFEEPEKLLLIHAGPHFNGASVNYDDGKKYITSLCGEKIWFSKIDVTLAKKWLLNIPIKPCMVM